MSHTDYPKPHHSWGLSPYWQFRSPYWFNSSLEAAPNSCYILWVGSGVS